MAKTKVSKELAVQQSIRKDWSPSAILAALTAAQKNEDPIAALKRSGILTKRGTLSPKYKSGGKNKLHITRAQDLSGS